MDNLDELINKIFEILNNSKPYINEFDVLDLTPSKEFYMFQENCLVLNKIYLKFVYKHLRDQFLSRLNNQFDQNVITLLILLINPQLQSAWYVRKELLSHTIEAQAFQHELRLNKILLVKHFKSEHAYMHRRWLIKRLLKSDQSIVLNKQFLLNEIDFIYKISFKIKSNYYCWSYINYFLIQYFNFYANLFDSKSDKVEFMNKLLNTHQKNVLELNVSDNCVFNYRLNLLNLIISNENSIKFNLIVNEFLIVDDLLFRYYIYQTVWNYRKYLLRLIQAKFESYFLHDSSAFQCLDKKLADNIRSNTYKVIKDEACMDKFEVDLLDCYKNEHFLKYLLNREIVLSKFVEFLFGDKLNKYYLINNKSYPQSHVEFLEKFF